MRWMIVMLLPLVAPTGPALGQDAVEGERTYRLHCAACHGADARGDGPMGALLLVPPSDLTTLEARYGDFPYLRVVTRIDGRDPLVSHGSDMPVWGWFFEGDPAAIKLPDGQPLLTTRPIVDLVAYLESIQSDDAD